MLPICVYVPVVRSTVPKLSSPVATYAKTSALAMCCNPGSRTHPNAIIEWLKLAMDSWLSKRSANAAFRRNGYSLL